MVSDTIRSLAKHFDGYARIGGIHLDATACAIVASTLHASADATQRMEGSPVPAGLRCEIPEGVVDLDRARQDRTLRAAAGGDWGAA